MKKKTLYNIIWTGDANTLTDGMLKVVHKTPSEKEKRNDELYERFKNVEQEVNERERNRQSSRLPRAISL